MLFTLADLSETSCMWRDKGRRDAMGRVRVALSVRLELHGRGSSVREEHQRGCFDSLVVVGVLGRGEYAALQHGATAWRLQIMTWLCTPPDAPHSTWSESLDSATSQGRLQEQSMSPSP